MKVLGKARSFLFWVQNHGTVANVLHNIDTGKEIVLPGFPAQIIFSMDAGLAGYLSARGRFLFCNPAPDRLGQAGAHGSRAL